MTMERRSANPLGRFTLRIFLWLPPCFAAWYFSTILITAALAAMLDVSMTWILPDLVEGVVRRGNDLLVLLSAEDLPSTALSGPMPSSIAAHPVDPVKYGYGMALYTTLLLATPGGESDKMGRWLVAMPILLLTQWLGVSAEILKDLVFGLEAARQALGLTSLGYEMLAIAYQLGYLILPSVTPLLLWGLQFRHDIPALYR